MGPFFVSIGDETKLRAFLDKNPNIPSDSIFVDSSPTFDAYDEVGFTSKFTDTSPEVAKQVKLQPPNLPGGFRGWIDYFLTVGKVSPIPKDGIKFGSDVPEGVLRLGGTFVVKGEAILYQRSDRLPGDHPVIDDVVSVAVNA